MLGHAVFENKAFSSLVSPARDNSKVKTQPWKESQKTKKPFKYFL